MSELRKEFEEILDALPEGGHWPIYRYIPIGHDKSDDEKRSELVDKLLTAVCTARGHFLIDEGHIEELCDDETRMHELRCKYCNGTKRQIVYRETLERTIIPLQVLLGTERCKCGVKP